MFVGFDDDPLNDFAKREVSDRVIDAVGDGEHVIEAMAGTMIQFSDFCLEIRSSTRLTSPTARAAVGGKRTAAPVATLYGKAMDAAVKNPILGNRFAAAAVAAHRLQLQRVEAPEQVARYPRNEDCGPGQVPSDFIFLTGRAHLQRSAPRELAEVVFTQRPMRVGGLVQPKGARHGPRTGPRRSGG